MVEHTSRPPEAVARRLAIFTSSSDSLLAANKRIAMQRFADAMGWVTVTVIGDDRKQLLDGAATHAFDLVRCWRTSDLRHAESLFECLCANNVELLAVAQSCTALLE